MFVILCLDDMEKCQETALSVQLSSTVPSHYGRSGLLGSITLARVVQGHAYIHCVSEKNVVSNFS